LQVDPEKRLTVSGILDMLAAVCESHNINVKEPLNLKGKRLDIPSPTHTIPSPGEIEINAIFYRVLMKIKFS
jgi:hypothetical protein